MNSSLAPKCRRCSALVALLLLVGSIPSEGKGAPSSDWAIDPARTHISFSIDAIGYPRTQGEFHRFAGNIKVDFDHPDRSRVTFQVESQSVDVGSEPFSDYLRSEPLLDAARFKEIVFSSTAVQKLDERNIVVIGNLTMLGVTRPLTVEVAVSRTGSSDARLGFTARAKIDRLQYGMTLGFPAISRDIDLVVASEAFE